MFIQIEIYMYTVPKSYLTNKNYQNLNIESRQINFKGVSTKM